MSQEFFDAATLGSAYTVQRMLAEDPALIHSRIDWGFTPLHGVAGEEQYEVAELLLKSGAEPKQINIVCHSRGGLVARWYCEAFASQKTLRKVVFVGSPLAGTSLAAAPRIRSTLEYFSNLAALGAKVLGWLPGAISQFIGHLLKLIEWVSSAASKLPLFDAAMAMIPALDAQGREGNNEEILRLRANSGSVNFANPKQIVYHAITADFQTEDVGWNFLKYFTDQPKLRALNKGADVIFGVQDELGLNGTHDLVVDTPSMTQLSDSGVIQPKHLWPLRSGLRCASLQLFSAGEDTRTDPQVAVRRCMNLSSRGDGQQLHIFGQRLVGELLTGIERAVISSGNHNQHVWMFGDETIHLKRIHVKPTI